MKSSDFQKLLFQSAVIVMACDGNIDETELEEIKEIANSEIYFMGYPFKEHLKSTIAALQDNPKNTTDAFLAELDIAELSEKQEIALIQVLLRIIEADQFVAEIEIKFLQLVSAKLHLSEEIIITKFPKYFTYLLDFKNLDLNFNFPDKVEFGSKGRV